MAATDVELVRGALAGAEPAFREIVQRYQRPVFGLIVRMVGDRGRAEELAQDTFVKAFRGLHTYDLQRKFSSWLLTVAHHVAIDELRKARLDVEPLEIVESGADRDGQTRTREIKDVSAESPAVAVERLELGEALRTAIARLRPEYREVVSLRYEQDLDYAEIVEITGLPMGTVKSTLHRARKDLAHTLETLGWAPQGVR